MKKARSFVKKTEAVRTQEALIKRDLKRAIIEERKLRRCAGCTLLRACPPQARLSHETPIMEPQLPPDTVGLVSR
eukprot:5522226-Pyramimonas_sp.AAC.1